MKPILYYNNAFARAEVLSGTQTDSANPVRRVGDSDLTLKHYLFSSGVVGDPGSGIVHATLAAAETRTHFVQPRATAVSGFTVKVYSSDVGGGNTVQHMENVLASSDSFVQVLSGVGTARRCWWVEYGTAAGGLGAANLYEVMLADKLEMPRSALIGTARAIQQNYQKMPVPGSASFKLRLGDDYRRVAYQFTVTSGEVVSIQTFLGINDGGEPFWFTDDLGSSYWAEMAAAQQDFDDQAGLYNYTMAVNEVPLEQ